MKQQLDGQSLSIDLYVARRIRYYRQRARLTLNQLAALLEDISFQQLQKYESGANRVSSSRLYQIAQLLSVPISAFFPRALPITQDSLSMSEAKDLQDVIFEGLDTKDVYNFLAACAQIEDPVKRSKALRLCLQILETFAAMDEVV